MSKKSMKINLNNTYYLKKVNHHLGLQQTVIFSVIVKAQRSLITDHHSKYNIEKV